MSKLYSVYNYHPEVGVMTYLHTDGTWSWDKPSTGVTMPFALDALSKVTVAWDITYTCEEI